jgi:hypothetical protein
MACENPFDAFRLATESLPDDIYVRASYRSIFMNLPPRGVYPRGAGIVRSTFTVGRSEPTTDEPAFEAVTVVDGETYEGACGTTYNNVEIGFVEGTYAPEKFGWRGPIICQDDLMINYNMENFLSLYVPAISKNTERTISNRFAAIYTHLVPKAAATTSFAYGSAGSGAPPTSPVIPLDQATCFLDQDMLDYTAVVLNEEGASDPDTNGWITLGEDGPVYPLYIGQEASAQILLQNAELRQDRRDADSGAGDMSLLFKRIGATKIIKNFRHIINLFPPRYSYNAGTGNYTRVPTFVMNNGTKGKVADVNPNWRSFAAAPYEGCWVLSPWVFTSEILQPVNSAAGLSWSPKNHVGEWDFVVGGKEISTTDCYDPLKKLGAHFAEFWHAPKPIYPLYGRFIVFKRCNAVVNCTSCS